MGTYIRTWVAFLYFALFALDLVLPVDLYMYCISYALCEQIESLKNVSVARRRSWYVKYLYALPATPHVGVRTDKSMVPTGSSRAGHIALHGPANRSKLRDYLCSQSIWSLQALTNMQLLLPGRHGHLPRKRGINGTEPGGWTAKGWKVMKKRKERKGTRKVKAGREDGNLGERGEMLGEQGEGSKGAGCMKSHEVGKRRNIISV